MMGLYNGVDRLNDSDEGAGDRAKDLWAEWICFGGERGKRVLKAGRFREFQGVQEPEPMLFFNVSCWGCWGCFSSGFLAM